MFLRRLVSERDMATNVNNRNHLLPLFYLLSPVTIDRFDFC
jgi:hypothetical protein